MLAGIQTTRSFFTEFEIRQENLFEQFDDLARKKGLLKFTKTATHENKSHLVDFVSLKPREKWKAY